MPSPAPIREPAVGTAFETGRAPCRRTARGLPPPVQEPDGVGELARLLLAASAATPGPPVPVEPTRRFGPRPPAPAPPARSRTCSVVIAIVATTLLIAAWIGIVAMAGGDGGPAHPASCATVPIAIPLPPGASFVKGDVSGTGCPAIGVYANQVLTIRLRPTDTQPHRFALGLPGDRLVLGDWDCDGVATPALERPSTGSVIYFNTWEPNERPSDGTGLCRTIASLR